MLGIILQITQTAGTVHDTVHKAAITVAQAQQQVDSLNLWELLVKGGIVMIPIALLSVLAVYFFFERLIAIKKASKHDTHFFNSIKDFICDAKLDSAKALCKSTNTPVARMVEKGINRIGKPISEIEKSIENVGRFEISKLEKNLKIL
jgi:biopolymer transport protein ExbB